MDAKKLIEMVNKAKEEGADYYRLASIIIDEQKEFDAQLAEAAGNAEIANTIRMAS